MTEQEVCDLPMHGVEVGAHTRTHPDLRTLPPDGLRQELAICRKELSTLLGKEINILAYPFGFHNEEIRKCAGEIYDLAFSCKPGLNAWGTDSRQLRRMFVHPSRVNFSLQVKYGVDLHAVHRFVRNRIKRWFRVAIHEEPSETETTSAPVLGPNAGD